MALFGQTASKPRETLLVTNWLFFALTVFAVSFFLLTDVSECESVGFCSTTIFIIVLFISFLMMLILWILSGQVRSRLVGKNNVLLFFLTPTSLQGLLWIPVGLLGVLGISFATASWDFQYAPHIGIFLSGIIMLIAFLRTHSILIPIFIHGIYNSIVIVLREGTGLSQSLPIPVPTVGLELPLNVTNNIVSEIFFQLILVASAEEMFKVFGIAFFVIASKGKFQSKGVIVWIGGIFSVLVWMILHTITAI